MNRNEEITRLRPDLSAELSTNGDEIMAYFNLTVMPVLKLQSPVLLKFLQQWAQRKSKHFELYKTTEKIRFVKVLLRENDLVHQAVLGIVHGALTTDECQYLFKHSDVLEKKIMKQVEGMVESNAVAI